MRSADSSPRVGEVLIGVLRHSGSLRNDVLSRGPTVRSECPLDSAWPSSKTPVQAESGLEPPEDPELSLRDPEDLSRSSPLR